MCFVCLQIARRYAECTEKLAMMREWSFLRPAFTCDLWRSKTGVEYYTCTMHYVDEVPTVAGAGEPPEWHLRRRVLGAQAIHEDTITAYGKLCHGR